MPTVTDAIQHGRRLIFAQEPQIVAQLLDAYESVWHVVERHIQRYEAQIQAAIDAGQTPSESWLRRQIWYRQMQDSIDAEFVRFNRSALSTLARGQIDAVGIAAESAELFRQAVGITGSLSGRVNPGAIERWVSALQPNSPIRQVFQRYGDRVDAALVKHITEGLGSGEGVQKIVRNITNDVGPVGVNGRLHSTVRTEVLRSYRGASRDSFEAMGPNIIEGWQWISARGTRTCLACLAMDGRRFPYTQYPDRFHVACRCVVRAIPRRDLVPETGRPRETGADWLARQDRDVQRRILGTLNRWDAYQQGTPISDFVGIKRSRTWGDSLVILPAGKVAS